ncbi:metalloregulator ArsR/SmtB family transcription factor [Virgisporangium ochraceum]|uniref:Transcriptional regulator n=1 Tax=Virgisporangium ochraceum TaxID=65505 RepID=A0A8J4A4F8_9ACTN|nr:metalloregulator ArsR/SmtB family transcription factor [Virgisporangium ochraceum]GIJ74956.1 transcriptional regulator [Virgisporangium ochraceum]
MPRPAADDDVFRAVADPTRRALIEALGRGGEQTVGALAEAVGQSVPLVSRHLAVLRSAGLVEERRAGRHRIYRLDPAPLRDLFDWAGLFAGFWTERVANLRDYLDRQNLDRQNLDRQNLDRQNGERRDAT